MADDETRDCPFCREEIKADAVLCKHCRSRLADIAPSHGGTCPYCKEEIHPEATRCKHCRSDLTGRASHDRGGGGCGGCGGGCGGCGGGRGAGRGPDARRQFSRPTAYSLREGSYPDPECFHECFWRCVDSTGDAQWCWIACAYICPEATATL